MKIFKGILYFLLYLILVILGIVFASSNSTQVELNLFGTIIGPYPLWLSIIGGIVLGVIATGFFAFFHIIALNFKINKLQKDLNKLDKLIQEERNNSIENE